ncbi:hypothetical protein PLESTB_001215600 [Pleodorina starrii]|uniref:Uncharacterized protein n=1 Tax=Pleodorina starrii TaxID=330485 RepID=A0A9W6BRX9_9CHLO|nr:hypothetical protein PLESTM_001643800 [Pleodorina starrii]GLC57356.1 hypothetical protein PLESTB_001215600 [Pleodorina starrii]GLC71246.1 hypothetical protein PLESTF_001094500 [Pleodorina starrii]
MVLRGALPTTNYSARIVLRSQQYLSWRSYPGASLNSKRVAPLKAPCRVGAVPDGGDDSIPNRRRGRPRKSQPQAGQEAAADSLDVGYRAYGMPGVYSGSDDESATDHTHQPQPSDEQLEPRQQPDLPRRRGRPRKAMQSRSGSSAGATPGNGASRSTSSHGASPLLESRRGRGRAAASAFTAAAAAAAAGAPRRPRGRPRLSSLPGSPLPAGACPARDVELRAVLLRHLDLQPEQLSPPPASWRRLMASTTATALGGRVSELCAALGPDAVRHIVRRCPHALQLTTDRILSKLAELNLRLRLPRSALIGAVCRFPALLGAAPGAVGERVALLVRELDKPEEFVVSMVVSQPVLLGLSPATLKYRIGLLHEAASLLPKWSSELSDCAPSSLGRLLRCSDPVLSRLTYTYLRTATNGRKFHLLRSMATICCQPAARWHRDNPLFLEWLAAGEEDRREGRVVRWAGWLQQGATPGEVDWWAGPPRKG